MEVLDAPRGIIENNWDHVKLFQAKRLLERGFNPRQIGGKLRLSVELIQELEVARTAMQLQPATETHEQWRARTAKDTEKLIVDIATNHLRAVSLIAEEGELDDKRMGTVVDASQIAHKWLKSGEEGIRTLSLNFSALAQIEPDMKTVQAVTLDLPAEDPPREAMDRADDWLA